MNLFKKRGKIPEAPPPVMQEPETVIKEGRVVLVSIPIYPKWTEIVCFDDGSAVQVYIGAKHQFIMGERYRFEINRYTKPDGTYNDWLTSVKWVKE